MIAVPPPPQPPIICPTCEEPGIHRTTQDCIEALRATLEQLRQAQQGASIRQLGYFVPSFWP